MILGITLLLRGREQVVLRIIVDHGLGEDLVVLVALGGCKLIFHEGCYLIHLKINVREILRLYIIHSGNVVQNASEYGFIVFCHFFITSAPYYIVFKTTCKLFFSVSVKMEEGNRNYVCFFACAGLWEKRISCIMNFTVMVTHMRQ